MDTKFVRDRITQLRLKKGISEYKISYDSKHAEQVVEIQLYRYQWRDLAKQKKPRQEISA